MNGVKFAALAVSVSLIGFAGCTSADIEDLPPPPPPPTDYSSDTEAQISSSSSSLDGSSSSADNTGSDDSSSSGDVYSSQTDSSSSMDKQISSSSSILNSSSSSVNNTGSEDSSSSGDVYSSQANSSSSTNKQISSSSSSLNSSSSSVNQPSSSSSSSSSSSVGGVVPSSGSSSNSGGGGGSCEYNKLRLCNGIPLNQVQGISSINLQNRAINDPYSPNHQKDGCIFVTNISTIHGAHDSFINEDEPRGIEWSCGDGSIESWINNPCSSVLPQKVDGGYYIFYKAWGQINYNYLIATNEFGNNLHPNCEAVK
jgi:hypothetical protein